MVRRVTEASAAWLVGGAGLSPLPDWLLAALRGVVFIGALLASLTLAVMSMIYLERRVIALMQSRVGPNRVGPEGLLQPLADVLKLLGKEDIIPAGADRVVFSLAPLVMVVSALLAYAVIPFSEGLVLTDLNIGLVYVLAVGSLSTIGVLMAGWGSNNKFALLGAMRAAAQIVSYEVPLVLSVVGVVLLTGSLSLTRIVEAQTVPFLLLQPLGFLVFLTASLAELNRTPFDLLEAESEIIAGYHTEYSGIRFALFFLAEYLNTLTAAALATALFLGGWRGPLLPPWLWFILKVYLVFFVIMWLRGTLPRVRIDQMLGLAWKILVPLALLNILLTSAGLSLVQAARSGGLA